MERLSQLLALLPELVAAGVLTAGGGSIAVRGPHGVHVSPTQASRELRWKLTEGDFVLFPGGGEASMARAGRQPSRENKLHRAVLLARPDWHCTVMPQGHGLLAFALAGRPLHVPEAHSALLDRYRPAQMPVVEPQRMGSGELAEAVVGAVERHFEKSDHGAVLIKDYGPFIAGASLETTLGLAQQLETLACARAALGLL